MRFEVLDIRSAVNHPPNGQHWDLRGLKTGRGYYNDLPFEIVDPRQMGGTIVCWSRTTKERIR